MERGFLSAEDFLEEGQVAWACGGVGDGFQCTLKDGDIMFNINVPSREMASGMKIRPQIRKVTSR